MKHLFKPYQDCNIFIETGSANGEGITAAINVGFPIIHSIELSPHYFNLCQRLFEKYPQVNLHIGNSIKVLPRILSSINERCVFWLDAHWCGGNTKGEGSKVTIIEELKIIAAHHIKEHTILIDDIRMLREKSELEWQVPYSVCDVEEFIYIINPNYKVSYEYGVVDDDILIARI